MAVHEERFVQERSMAKENNMMTTKSFVDNFKELFDSRR